MPADRGDAGHENGPEPVGCSFDIQVFKGSVKVRSSGIGDGRICQLRFKDITGYGFDSCHFSELLGIGEEQYGIGDVAWRAVVGEATIAQRYERPDELRPAALELGAPLGMIKCRAFSDGEQQVQFLENLRGKWRVTPGVAATGHFDAVHRVLAVGEAHDHAVGRAEPDLLEADEPPDAVFDVHHEVARRQARKAATIMKFVERFRAKATKARQVQSRLKALEKLELSSAGHADSPYEFSFPNPQRMSPVLIQIDDATLG